MIGSQAHNTTDRLIDLVSFTLLTLGTIAGCWLLFRISKGAGDNADIVVTVITGLALGFVVSGFVIMPLREAVRSLCGRNIAVNAKNGAMSDYDKRLRQQWNKAAAHL
jgi:hypothetical protein